MLKHYVSFKVWLATRNNGKSKGQSLAEYGLVLALIAVVCIGSLSFLGTNIDSMLRTLADRIKGGSKL